MIKQTCLGVTSIMTNVTEISVKFKLSKQAFSQRKIFFEAQCQDRTQTLPEASMTTTDHNSIFMESLTKSNQSCLLFNLLYFVDCR